MRKKIMFVAAFAVWLATDMYSLAQTVSGPAYPDFKAAIRRVTPSVVFLRGFVFHYDSWQPPHLDVAGKGTGIVVNPDGYILTNHHVVENRARIDVLIENKKFLRAKVVGVDQENDLALIKVELPPNFGKLAAVRFAKQGSVSVGDWALKAGFPGTVTSMDTPTFTLGIISHLRTFKDNFSTPFGATDTQMGPGDSGGMLFDIRGDVIGMNESISKLGVNYFIPIEVILKSLPKLYHGDVRTGWLGLLPGFLVDMRDIDRDDHLLSHLRLFLASKNITLPQTKEGILVMGTLDARAGDANQLHVGDVITQVNGKVPQDRYELSQWIAQAEPGEKLTFQIIREGAHALLHLKVGEYPWESGFTLLPDPYQEQEQAPEQTP